MISESRSEVDVTVNAGLSGRFLVTAFPTIYHLTPLAIPHEIHTGITAIHLQETLGLLVTSGHNRVIMIWDVRSVCSALSGSQ
ncbi:WD_REPEATS_REGION domain-containing protein [Caenorhabditis elegans]|uniref:WD_REPEATS_REGION domain-containing protein n=1 Tax=Caenorhabditis elegans TaxID=6239 RepID=A0A5S9MNB4_CAEEL|nr:WD_REPEATS_REGION domain-containing protein [Caenorhabditis elegans]CAA0059144.1 WD_REPEATS_REGION domain-containing protein [Caenorhabditis elegans]